MIGTMHRLVPMVLLSVLALACAPSQTRSQPSAGSSRSLGTAAPEPGAEAKPTGRDGPRRALVIGNGAYRHAATLENPAHDARAMAAVLQKLGFELASGEALLDLDESALERAIEDFGRKLEEGASAALFFYAGHAVEVGGHNFMVPVDAKVTSESDARRELIGLDLLMQELSHTAGTKIVVLDACRNNPFAGADRALVLGSGGLAPQVAPGGTVVAFSTAPGRTAADGTGDNSPYTAALLGALEKPELRLEDVFIQVRNEVKQKTGGAQQPWEHTSLGAPFYFWPERKEGPEQKCFSGDAKACSLLADRARSGGALLEAAGLYARACQAGAASSCVGLGRLMVESDSPLRENPGKARELFRQACDAEVSPGCVEWGVLLRAGLGGARDVARSGELFEQACSAGDGYGCAHYAQFLSNTPRSASEYQKAVALNRAACDSGIMHGCAGLGMMYARGLGVEHDDVKGAELAKRACEGGSMRGCRNLGIHYAEGKGVRQDFGLSATLYERACEEADALACRNLGLQYEQGSGVAKDPNRARVLYEKACDYGHAIACANLALAYEKGEGVTRDLSRALAYLERSCREGSGEGCLQLSDRLAAGKAGPPDKERIQALKQDACELGEERACAKGHKGGSAGSLQEADIAHMCPPADPMCGI